MVAAATQSSVVVAEEEAAPPVTLGKTVACPCTVLEEAVEAVTAQVITLAGLAEPGAGI